VDEDSKQHQANAGRARWAKVTAEERAEVLSRAAKAFWANLSPEERTEIMSARVKKAWEKRRRRRED
jgi:predicted Fe-S protein YdhL (DUF1289 family)